MKLAAHMARFDLRMRHMSPDGRASATCPCAGRLTPRVCFFKPLWAVPVSYGFSAGADFAGDHDHDATGRSAQLALSADRAADQLRATIGCWRRPQVQDHRGFTPHLVSFPVFEVSLTVFLSYHDIHCCFLLFIKVPRATSLLASSAESRQSRPLRQRTEIVAAAEMLRRSPHM